MNHSYLFSDGKKILRNLLLVFGIGFLLVSCNRPSRNFLFDTPRKYERLRAPIVHIGGDSTKSNADEYEHVIQTDDRLSIRFINDVEFASQLQATAQQNNSGMEFVVDRNGNISLPLLGLVNVGGQTRFEVQEMLFAEYSKSFKNPSIEVRLVGLSVSVQGEVARPNIYPLPREKTTLVEVIATAGGITAFGKKRVVKVVRGAGNGNEPEIFIFDLTQLDAIESSEMILRDKDIVYVEPRNIRAIANALAPYSTFLAFLSSVGSIAVITYSITRTQ